MTARMLAAVANPHTDVLGHCTGRLVIGRRQRDGTQKPRPESQFDAEAVFAACVEFGTAVEINSRPERLDPPKRLLRQAVELGCEFAIDTDAHAPGQLDWQGNGCERAVECGVTRRTAWSTPGRPTSCSTGPARPRSGCSGDAPSNAPATPPPRAADHGLQVVPSAPSQRSSDPVGTRSHGRWVSPTAGEDVGRHGQPGHQADDGEDLEDGRAFPAPRRAAGPLRQRRDGAPPRRARRPGR